jgi:hypothetical protein
MSMVSHISKLASGLNKEIYNLLKGLSAIHPVFIAIFYIATLNSIFNPIMDFKHIKTINFPFLLFGALLPLFFISKKITKPSEMLVIILYLIVYIPIIIFSFSSDFTVQMNIFKVSLVACFNILIFINNGNVIFKNKIKLTCSKTLSYNLLKYIILLGLMLMVFIFGTPVFGEKYEVRFISRKIISLSPIPFTSYIVAILQNILCPAAIIFGLRFKNKSLLFLSFAITMYLFCSTRQTGLLVSFFSISSMLIVVLMYRRFLWEIIFCSQLLIAIMIMILSLNQDIFGLAGILRRIYKYHIILPPLYLEYFNHFGFTYLAESKLVSYLMDWPQQASPAKLVGMYFFNPNNHANENFWSEAYANFGFYGMFLYTAILLMLLKLYDGMTENRDFITSCFLIIPVALTLTSSGLPTTLLSGGMICLYFLVFLIPVNPEKKATKQHTPS